MAKLCSEAGLPDGVLNVVPGKGSVAGQALTEHPGISKIAFTGSTEVGKSVMKTAAGAIKKSIPRTWRQGPLHSFFPTLTSRELSRRVFAEGFLTRERTVPP